MIFIVFFFSSRRRHTRFDCDWSSDVCSSDLSDGPARVTVGSAGTLMVMRNNAKAVDFAASVILAVNTRGPTASGIPEISPVFGSSVSPSGRPFDVQVYGGTPPDAARLTS